MDNGVYYQPPQTEDNSYYQEPPKKNKGGKTAIIVVSVIAALIFIACIAAIVFANVGYNKITDIASGDNASSGSFEMENTVSFSGENIRELELNWVAGEIVINHYDDNNITITEGCKDKAVQMYCTCEDGVLKVCYSDDENFDIHAINEKHVEKDLVINLPYDISLDEIDIEVVASDVTMSDIVCSDFEFSTVGGDGSFAFSKQPYKVSIESVGGNTELYFKNDISGYTIDTTTISGKIVDNLDKHGDGRTKIDFESVGGNLTINEMK